MSLVNAMWHLNLPYYVTFAAFVIGICWRRGVIEKRQR